MSTTSGDTFDASFWRSVQRISTLHMLLIMAAVIGLITSGSILAAPNGFGGGDTVIPTGIGIGIISIILFAVSLPFATDIIRIHKQAHISAFITTISLGLYLTLFFTLFFEVGIALIIGLILSAVIWLMIGGRHLIRVRSIAQVSDKPKQ